MDIPHLREQIPATRNVTYLNTGWSGPSPKIVLERIKDWLDFENYEGPTAPHVLEQRRQLQLDAREAVAGLLNASTEEIALTQNTSEGINIVLNGMTWRPGDELVTTNLEHTSGIVPAYYLGRYRRVKVRIVDIAGLDNPSAIVERLETALSPRTRLVLLSHVMYLTGLLLPLKEIQQMARSHGLPVLVDAAQSAGQMPLDMKDLGCDFYSIPGHKWLLGPDGTGALYIRRDLIPQIRPYKVAHKAAADVDLHGHWKPVAESITKFELTTTSAPLWAGMAAAIGFLQDIGLGGVQKRIRSLSSIAVGKLRPLPNVSIVSPQHPQLTSGLLTFSVADIEPRQVVDYLWEKGNIICRSVDEPAGVRLSLDFFNTEEEIDKVVDCLRSLAK